MKIVKQLDRTGCGLACVAMLTDQSYTAVKKKALKSGLVDSEEYLGTATTDLYMLLKPHKILTSKKRVLVKDINTIPEHCILAVKNKNIPGRNWHWVVYKEDKIYDPGYGKVYNFKTYKTKMKLTKIHYVRIYE